MTKHVVIMNKACLYFACMQEILEGNLNTYLLAVIVYRREHFLESSYALAKISSCLARAHW